MSYSAIKEVQVAVVDRLEHDTTLSNIRGITGIFDEAPTDQPYPYITIGTKTQTNLDTFTKSGWEVLLVLDIWTDKDGGDVHFDIVDDIDRLFNSPKDDEGKPWRLPLVSFDNAECVVEWTTTLIDESEECRHTVCRLRTLNT